MVVCNLGSVSVQVLNIVENVPSYISGAPLLQIIDNERLFIESYTGQTIGSTAIAEKFVPALVDLSCSRVLTLMEVQGTDASSISLGDLSINKGKASATMSAGEYFNLSGMEKLKRLGKISNFYKVNG